MKLQTIVPLNKEENQISYQSELLLIGSCFVLNMGSKFEYYKFKSVVNPFGIIFNPNAIDILVERAVNNKKFEEKDIFFFNERWHCYEVHSDLSDVSKENLLHNLNQALDLLSYRLKKSTHIIITLGTSWVYRLNETGKLVANCHKVPQNNFTKHLLSTEEITENLENILNNVKNINNRAEVIFTVSPVRHLKDGFTENQASKSHLITALHEILNRKSGNINLTYFPSYEIMIDELRDYRFYKEDMVHPNSLAVNYIWEKFKAVWISESDFSTMEEVASIQKSLTHKPFNPESDQHKKFLKSLSEKIMYLQLKYPFIKF
ncbi:GSCFA domain-containing protein [Abyssalbus ytuae]|uniref:GSCFA domain-containing protein n=1 Tax=Abyssalbus ytuae TaxID=2926907 RepID=A0A9E6ZTG3_9FLAO|nr:GSCFA domain-containing protein [Abyssalbus ytuae]UOB18558.1 GSCFA domain-containing protein [Abyssalbus ytuae]